VSQLPPARRRRGPLLCLALLGLPACASDPTRYPDALLDGSGGDGSGGDGSGGDVRAQPTDAAADAAADAADDGAPPGALRFESPRCFPAAPSLDRVVPGDVDRDGRADALLEYLARPGDPAAPSGFGYARSVPADGGVGFDPRVDRLSTAGAPLPAAGASRLADLDGDGLPELARDARWWRNGQGAAGPFSEATFAGAGRDFVSGVGFITPEPATLTVIDLDGDGLRDLAAVQNPTGCAVLAYPNRGTPGSPDYATQRILRVYVRGLTRCTSLAFGDLDDDGRPDAVVTSENPDRGSGEQGFAALRNLSAPGRLEESSFGAPVRFTTAPEGGRRSTANALLADFDGDGRPDLFYTTAQPGVPGARGVLRLNARPGALDAATFGPAIDLPGDLGDGAVVSVVDLDGDGDPDLASAAGARVTLLQNPGARGGPLAGAGFARSSLALDGAARAPALADVDGDGRADVLFARDGAFCVARGAGP